MGEKVYCFYCNCQGAFLVELILLMKKIVVILAPLLLLSCIKQLTGENVPVDDPANDRAAVSFPAPPKVPDVQQ